MNDKKEEFIVRGDASWQPKAVHSHLENYSIKMGGCSKFELSIKLYFCINVNYFLKRFF